MKEKNCPVCQKEEWNYDVIEGGTGEVFCGDCHFAVVQIASKLTSKKPYNRVIWNEAKRQARKNHKLLVVN